MQEFRDLPDFTPLLEGYKRGDCNAFLCQSVITTFTLAWERDRQRACGDWVAHRAREFPKGNE